MTRRVQRYVLMIACCLLGVLAAAPGGRVGAAASSRGQGPSDAPKAEPPWVNESLRGFRSIRPIDAHTHDFRNDPEFQKMLKDLHLHVLDILVVSNESNYSKALEPQHTDALTVVHGSQGRAVLCTTLNPYKFAEPDFDAQTIKFINADFAHGAVAMKIWKNVGMQIRKADGSFLLPDDPVFDPIYDDIQEHDRTLLAHLAEPDSCWMPPNEANPDYGYYKSHPLWYMYLHPDFPQKAQILAARDHILEKHRDLRVVGAHLGSMEADVDQIAARFEKYPNFAVDMAARQPYLMMEPHGKVRAFLIKYQDRILYATDLEYGRGGQPGSLEEWRETYARDWRFFATGKTVEYKGHQYQGLKLPHEVLVKIFHTNATRWYPGIDARD
jgi:predicted TIM-barrel fold metal-dependent hydrolase